MRELIRHILREETSFASHKEDYQKYDKIINKLVYLIFDEGICSFTWDTWDAFGNKTDSGQVVRIILNFTPESFRELGNEKYHKLSKELKDAIMDYVPLFSQVYVAYDTTKCDDQLNESNNKLQQGLKQVIDNGNIFDAADMVGGLKTLKRILKDDPEMSSLFEKLTGTITFYYYLSEGSYMMKNMKFPLKYEIIGRKSNVHKTNYWPEINVFYDENKLTPEENDTFKSMIKYSIDESNFSDFDTKKFGNYKLFNVNYFTVKELNGENIDLIGGWYDFSNREVGEIHDKLYDGNESINESEEKQAKYLNILKNLVEPFKGEDCVCDVGVFYDSEDDTYTVTLEVGMKELRGKSNNSFVRAEYVRALKRDVKSTIEDYLPIQNIYVSSIATPGCESERWWDKSINESSNKEKSLVKLIEKDGLYDIIEMTGLDFNQIRSLLKHTDNPKEILKQFIREFVLEKGGTTGENYGSLFALQIPLSDTKYVEDILVHDNESIAIEMWEYHLDEYGHREQKDQYLTTINNLTNEELLSIVAWMMETIKGNFWD